MRIFILSLVTLCLLSGCLKSKNNDECGYPDSNLVAPAAEIQNVQNYLTTNNITAQQHSSGVFYAISSQGSGQGIVNLCSYVAVRYKGKLTSGAVFDSTDASGDSFQLGQVIPGWQKGLPLISKGGKITLYIPPTLGYGNQDVRNNAGVVVIPANSILIFEIELADVG